MKTLSKLARVLTLAAAAVLAIAGIFLLAVSATAKPGYFQSNLVSDIPGIARFTDPNLVNPWGLALNPNAQKFWAADNGTGVATIYDPEGNKISLTVTIPPPMGGTPPSAPTGEVFNPTCDFVIPGTSSPAIFIWDTEDGTISAWNPAVNPTQAILIKDNSSSGAVYKGLALCPGKRGKSLLFAANFTGSVVEEYDANFNLIRTFTDPSLPALFSPFGIRCINNQVFVTYAKHKFPGSKDDQSGPGNGFIVVFDTNGHIIRRFASMGTLNSPWGLAVAPGKFGIFSNALIVGNFGDGRLNAFDLRTGFFLGQLTFPGGQPITISGLWGLEFLPANPFSFQARDRLYFNAGLNDEADGLFGFLFPSLLF